MVIVSLSPGSAASAFSLAQHMLKTKGLPGHDRKRRSRKKTCAEAASYDPDWKGIREVRANHQSD